MSGYYPILYKGLIDQQLFDEVLTAVKEFTLLKSSALFIKNRNRKNL